MAAGQASQTLQDEVRWQLLPVPRHLLHNSPLLLGTLLIIIWFNQLHSSSIWDIRKMRRVKLLILPAHNLIQVHQLVLFVFQGKMLLASIPHDRAILIRLLHRTLRCVEFPTDFRHLFGARDGLGFGSRRGGRQATFEEGEVLRHREGGQSRALAIIVPVIVL